TPALVVGQMPMKLVHLKLSHYIEILLNDIHTKKMTADIQFKSAIGIRGLVADLCAWNSLRTIFFKKLKQTLHTVEQPCICKRRNGNIRRSDIQRVAFIGNIRSFRLQ